MVNCSLTAEKRVKELKITLQMVQAYRKSVLFKIFVLVFDWLQEDIYKYYREHRKISNQTLYH